MRRVTIKDVAKEVGVSAATVSLVLNNKAKHISKKTITKVQIAAKKLGFVYNLHAQSLKTSQSKTIGLILPDITNNFFATIAKSVEQSLAAYGYFLLLVNTDNMVDYEGQALIKFQQIKVDGIILVASSEKTYRLMDRLALPIPILFLDRMFFDTKYYAIAVDDYQGGALAAQEFIRYHHYQVVCVTGSKQFVNVQERLRGFCAVFSQQNHAFDIKEFVGDFSIESGRDLARTIFEQKYRAIFFLNDLMAIGFYHACQEHGYLIPDDYSVIGYDDIQSAAYLAPPLTTIQQPMHAIGQQAVQILLNKEPRPDKLNVQLMRRKSVMSYSLKS